MRDSPRTGIASSTQSGLADADSSVLSITFWPSSLLCDEGFFYVHAEAVSKQHCCHRRIPASLTCQVFPDSTSNSVSHSSFQTPVSSFPVVSITYVSRISRKHMILASHIECNEKSSFQTIVFGQFCTPMFLNQRMLLVLERHDASRHPIPAGLLEIQFPFRNRSRCTLDLSYYASATCLRSSSMFVSS